MYPTPGIKVPAQEPEEDVADEATRSGNVVPNLKLGEVKKIYIEIRGDANQLRTNVIESLFAGDLRFLEEMYNRINEDEATVNVTCPECGARFGKEFGRLGE